MPGISVEAGLAIQNGHRKVKYSCQTTQTKKQVSAARSLCFLGQPVHIVGRTKSFSSVYSKQIVIVTGGKTQLCLLKPKRGKKKCPLPNYCLTNSN